MSANENSPVKDPRKVWTPPPRPDWLKRVNEEGACMDIRGVVPLDSASMLAAAQRSTGLSDFGIDDWREPFGVLCKSFDEDADLNLFGRIKVRHELLLLLKNRLQIEDTYKRHPEIDEQEIVKPLMIIGQGRSGTSFLLNLLSANPDNGNVMTWEAMFSCPPPEPATYHSDPRIEKAHKIADQWNRVVPELMSMHEYAGTIPQEDVPLLAHSFRNVGWFMVWGEVLQYYAYMANADLVPAYRYHKRILKLLQWKNPRKQWVLKNSANLEELPDMLKVYPDACIVWPHRDPSKSVASTVSLIGSMLYGQCDHPFQRVALDQYMDPHGAAKRLTAVIDLMESGVVPKARVCSVLYRDLVSDPVGTAAKIHAYFHLPFSAQSRAVLEEYMRRNPRENRPPHKVSPETRAAVERDRPAFKRYQEYFGVPDEV
jgi:Sulfotransferase family